MVNKNLIGGWVLLMLALMILVLPMQWVLAAVLAAMFHELCHYGAARLCGGNVAQLRVGTFGAQMEVWGLTNLGELVCALAGPLGSAGCQERQFVQDFRGYIIFCLFILLMEEGHCVAV